VWLDVRWSKGIIETLHWNPAKMRLALTVVVLLHAALAAAARDPPTSTTMLVEAGRKIYQEGVLPNGETLLARRSNGLTTSGEHAACILCHRRSGFGQVEGRSLVPPVVGSVLFSPGRYRGKAPPQRRAATGIEVVPSRVEARPAYDAASLGRALREGVDPAGQRFAEPMPRYELDEVGLAALAAYLRQLSSIPPPGVTADAMHVATIVAPGMPAARRLAMLDTLGEWFKQRRTGRRWILHVWDLQGKPDAWEEQLDRNYAEEPVFAVLSGLGGGQWSPVHRFCERAKLPCVLPNIELAPPAEGDFYSVYFSAGLTLEAAALAKYLKEQGATDRPIRVVQIFSDPAGERAAAALGEALGDSTPVETRRYDRGAPMAALEGLADRDALVLWLRGDEVSTLTVVAPAVLPVSAMYLSATLSAPEDARLPAAWRQSARIVTQFDDPARQRARASMALIPWLSAAGRPLTDSRVQSDTFAAAYCFADALARTRGPTNREWLIESLERIETCAAAAGHPFLSLGPGQRHAVKSATILRYRPPGFEELDPLSRRIVPD
jgi:hypothetical protein